MKISARDEYACSAVLELALNFDGEAPVRVQDIAERQGIPIKFLFQIMQILKRIDIVRSKRGTEGGYVLTRPPGQISIGDVIRASAGPSSSFRVWIREAWKTTAASRRLPFQSRLGGRGSRDRFRPE